MLGAEEGESIRHEYVNKRNKRKTRLQEAQSEGKE